VTTPAATTTTPATKPAAPASGSTGTQKPAATASNAATAKPNSKLEKPPVLAPASPVAPPISRDTQAAQLLEVAKAKLANNLIEPGLADLRQLIIDFPGSRAAAEAAFMAGEIYDKAGRQEEAMAAYVEFEQRFGNDRRVADAKIRRSAILGRQRQPKSQSLSLQLLNEVARDYPGSPQAQLALQTKLRIEQDRKDLRALDPVTKQEGPAVIATLRTIIEQFPDSPSAIVARNRLALTLADMNRYKDAADVLEELAAKGGDSIPVDLWWRVGEIYERRLNDPAKAKEAYAKVPPGSPRYNDAQRKLTRK
jgi:TolA-binding protein